MLKIKYNGRILECVTLVELAKKVGRSKHTLIMYQIREIMPYANLRFGGTKMQVFTMQLSTKLIPLFNRIEHGKPTPPEVIQQINQAFQEERLFINSNP